MDIPLQFKYILSSKSQPFVPVFILFEWFNYEYGLPYNTVTLSNLCSQSNLVKQRSRISSTNNSIKMLIDFDIYELVPVPQAMGCSGLVHILQQNFFLFIILKIQFIDNFTNSNQRLINCPPQENLVLNIYDCMRLFRA